jgi:hypothetical protein
MTVVVVGSQRCQGCRQIEPHLAHLQRQIKLEFGDAANLVQIDTNNEVFFLKHVERTPAILVYEK